MTDDKWQDLVSMAQKNFPSTKLSTEDIVKEVPDGPETQGTPQYHQAVQGTRDILIFKHPSGLRYKLVRENHPVVLEKKQLFSHRAGQSAQAQYKFSATEVSHKLRVYKEIDFDDWEEITLDKLGL